MLNILIGMKKGFTILLLLLLVIIILSFFAVPSVDAQSASLYLSPSSGTFFVGSTFSVSIVIDTKGNEINAVEVDLKFPPDILQVTSPTAGESFIAEWLTPPSYSNIGGTVSFKGGIPGGITASAGLISTITFRARSSGTARVEFSDSSKILLHDGKGTPIFTKNFGGVYEILIPLPESPQIFSYSHPEPDVWYSNSSPSFSWEKEEGVIDFSFSFSQNPLENPDTISEGDIIFKSYDDVPDGIWYFHLRSKKDGLWGTASHFQVKIDTTPPQKFEPRVDAYAGFVYFETKDSHSGIDRYEISFLDLNQVPAPTPFFIEAGSPFKIPFKEPGKYKVIVGAYDRAGNYQESETTFRLISPLVSYIEGKGIQIKGILFSWQIIYVILFLFLGGIGYFIFYLLKRKGYKKGIKEIREALSEIKKIEDKEEEVQRLREKFQEEKAKLEEKLK